MMTANQPRAMNVPYRPIHLAIAVLVLTYLATTGLGAAFFTFQFGREQLAAHLWPLHVPFDRMTLLGSPIYWALLLSMIVLTPAAAIATERAFSPIAGRIKFPDIPTWVVLSLAAALSAFCIYRLTIAGALSASEAWDRSVCYVDKILRRVELFGLLGNRYYCFAYSSLPILSCYLLAQGITRNDRVALLGWAISSPLILWLDVATMMKAPAIIYVGMLGLTLMLCGFGLIRSITVAAPTALALYAALSVMQFCDGEEKRWDRTMPAEIPPAVMVPVPPMPTVAPPPIPEKPFVSKIVYMSRAVIFRMAAGFPYYVQTFSDPAERCGIELPLRDWLPKQSCFGPIKIFREMTSAVGSTVTVGYQPGPINATALGEAGPWYVLAATLACGIIIGLISSFGAGGSPLSISLSVAACIYAYYASQASLTGSLLDSYGLVWLLFPAAIMLSVGLFEQRVVATSAAH
jgi:hypothetical protein